MLKDIIEIHENFVNGNIREAVKLIDEMGASEFFPDYQYYLFDLCHHDPSEYEFFRGLVLAYFRIKGR